MAIMSYETVAIKYRINKKSQNGITLGQTILNNAVCVVLCLFSFVFVGFSLLAVAAETARLIGANLVATENVSKVYDTLGFSPYSFGSIFEDWKRRILSPKPLIASRVPWLLYLKSKSPEKFEKEIQKYQLAKEIIVEVVPTLYRFNAPEVPLPRVSYADLAVQTSRLQDTPPNIADLCESSAFNVTKVSSRYLRNSSPRVGNTLYFENESGNIPSQASQVEIKEIVLENVKDLQSVPNNLEIVKVPEKERKKIRKKSKETRTPRVNELPTKKEKTTF